MLLSSRAYGSAFEQWRAAAGGRTEVWRLLLGLLIVVVFVLAGNVVLNSALIQFAPWIFTQAGEFGGTVATMLVLLMAFGLITIAVTISCVKVHHRGLDTVIGPIRRARGQFLSVIRWLVGLQIVLWLFVPVYGDDIVANLPFGTWLFWLPFGLVAVFVQTSAEEILFRGYIQQQLAARFRSPLIWALVPSMLFAAGHYMPGEAGPNAMALALWSGVFGLLLADLTARAGTLGPAIACHFANNVASLLLVSLADGMNGLSLYVVPYDLDDPEALITWMPVEFASMFVIWLAARVAIRA